jgi:hypothetical protein
LKWARYGKRPPGRPQLPTEVQELVLRLAKENPRWVKGAFIGFLPITRPSMLSSGLRKTLQIDDELPEDHVREVTLRHLVASLSDFPSSRRRATYAFVSSSCRRRARAIMCSA